MIFRSKKQKSRILDFKFLSYRRKEDFEDMEREAGMLRGENEDLRLQKSSLIEFTKKLESKL